ncbi:Regulator of RpoS [Candidatus Lokiarchaeum ossiferum]|uniref:Regulator of RpoS n=1 Tax=Candidatus Lokiarchaeum ossiferum TaxID=2951803 RepID=A0ABY6HX51_9ARCH|nr:Regulator of RpoS [Candidatus Lokiarchaeum sp. B-35]
MDQGQVNISSREFFNILIVEDNPDDAELLIRFLKKHGFHFNHLVVDTFQKFQNELHHQTWDLILSDYNLPTFSGIDALTFLQSTAIDIPFILISGNIGEDAAVEAMVAGAQDYIMKDNLIRLIPAIKRELKEASIRRNLKNAENEIVHKNAIIRQGEENYRLIFENSPVGICYYDTQGLILACNSMLSIIVQKSRKEMLAMNLMDAPLNLSIKDKILTSLEGNLEQFEGHIGENKKKNTPFVRIDFVPMFEEDSTKIVGGVSIWQNISTQHQYEIKLKSSLKEKDVLLREIHHRVKNNLQIISSFIVLQQKYIKDDKMRLIYRDFQSRINSMALIHEHLYKMDNLDRISFEQYVKKLLKDLLQTYGNKTVKITSSVKITDLNLELNTAFNCALLINEIITNALSHAFTDKQTGRISIEMKKLKESQMLLQIKDNGIGIPKDINIENPISMGLTLINAFVKQMNGTIKVKNDHGTTIKIVFQIKKSF